MTKRLDALPFSSRSPDIFTSRSPVISRHDLPFIFTSRSPIISRHDLPLSIPSRSPVTIPSRSPVIYWLTGEQPAAPPLSASLSRIPQARATRPTPGPHAMTQPSLYVTMEPDWKQRAGQACGNSRRHQRLHSPLGRQGGQQSAPSALHLT